MTMTEHGEILQVWGTVKTWPQPLRLSLASKILRSIEDEQTGPERTFADVIGIWKDMPSLSDEDVERILDEERMRKHG